MLVYCCVLQFLQRVKLLAHALTCWLIMSIIKLFFSLSLRNHYHGRFDGETLGWILLVRLVINTTHQYQCTVHYSILHQYYTVHYSTVRQIQGDIQGEFAPLHHKLWTIDSSFSLFALCVKPATDLIELVQTVPIILSNSYTIRLKASCYSDMSLHVKILNPISRERFSVLS